MRKFVILLSLLALCLIVFSDLFFSSTAGMALPREKSDAIVLLPGNYQERKTLALSLYQRGYGTSILLVEDGIRRSWSKALQKNPSTTERGAYELAHLGVPKEQIICLPYKKSGTVFDAMAVRDYVAGHGIHSLLVVTTNSHAKRALWIFSRVFQGMPTRINVASAPSLSHSLFSLDRALELFKFAYYRFRYGGLFGNLP